MRNVIPLPEFARVRSRRESPATPFSARPPPLSWSALRALDLSVRSGASLPYGARDIRVELVGQAADDDDKYTRKQGGDADRDVALAVGEVQVIARGRRDVQGCLGKEPEGNDRQDNSQDQPVVTFVGWCRGEAQVRVGHLGI